MIWGILQGMGIGKGVGVQGGGWGWGCGVEDSRDVFRYSTTFQHACFFFFFLCSRKKAPLLDLRHPGVQKASTPGQSQQLPRGTGTVKKSFQIKRKKKENSRPITRSRKIFFFFSTCVTVIPLTWLSIDKN